MARDGKITRSAGASASAQPLGLNCSRRATTLAPYFVEEIRKYLESTYGTEAVHERGLRVYTTLNVAMQRAADRAVRDGLHAYDRRHGWRGNLPNILADTSRHAGYLRGRRLAQADRQRRLRKWPGAGRGRQGGHGQDRAVPRRARRRRTSPGPDTVARRDSAARRRHAVHIREISGSTAKVELEQDPGPQAAMVAIDNGSGEIKAMVGGYSFEDSKFNRATQAQRQVGSSFKVYVYAAAMEQGFTPFDTILDAPFTVMSGGQPYSPHNYDEKYEGRDHVAARAGGIAQRARREARRKDRHQQRDRHGAALRHHQPACRPICRSRSAPPI